MNEGIGILVIRAWVEEGSLKPLRVMVRLTTDSSTGFTRELVLVDTESVVEVVRLWLEDVLAQRQ